MNPNLASIKKEWYKKLKDSGFEDIETDDGKLIRWSSSYLKQVSKEGRETQQHAKESYYRLAGQFYHSYLFETRQEKLVWELHSSGKSMRDIAKVIKMSSTTVKERIHKLRNIMFKEAKVQNE